jgi:hypothetical protein
MAEKVPIRAIYDGSDTCGLSELRVGEVVGVEHGGLGACTLTTNGLLLGNTQGAVQVSSALTTNGQILIGGTSGPAVANVTGTTNEVEITSGDGSIAIGLPSTVSGLTNVSATNLTGTLATAAQANVTSVGTLTSLNSSGNVSFDGGTFIFNESGADKDFRIEGDSNANLFMADASVDRIGIGTATPSHLLDVEGVAHVATCIVTPKICITSQYALPAADGSAGEILCTDGSGAVAFAEAASSGHTIANEGSALASRTCLNFVGTAVTAADNALADATDVTICATNAFLPVREADGTACCVTLATAAIGECLQSDTSPKLGGSLDVNGNSIISASNGNIPITPNGTGSVVISKISITGDSSLDGGSFVFNESGADKDFRIEGDTAANLFITDASTDRIGIGTATPSHLVDIEGVGHAATYFVSADLCATTKVVSPALCVGSQYVLPTSDGSAGQLMCTNGSGALAFAAAATPSGVDDIKGYINGGTLKWEVASGTTWSFGWWQSSNGQWWLLGNTAEVDTFTRAQAEFYIPTGDIADVPSS